jgi:hypothetical protein
MFCFQLPQPQPQPQSVVYLHEEIAQLANENLQDNAAHQGSIHSLQVTTQHLQQETAALREAKLRAKLDAVDKRLAQLELQLNRVTMRGVINRLERVMVNEVLQNLPATKRPIGLRRLKDLSNSKHPDIVAQFDAYMTAIDWNEECVNVLRLIRRDGKDVAHKLLNKAHLEHGDVLAMMAEADDDDEMNLIKAKIAEKLVEKKIL